MLWFTFSSSYFEEPTSRVDHFALLVFAITGAVVMTSFSNMIMLFLGIEILSISLYILAGSNKSNLASNEAALKYFLMGSFATGFLLFGIALLYGATGSFNIALIAEKIAANGLDQPVMITAGLFLMMIAMAFKVSAAPFHWWAPDVYQGSPTVITAFMSTVVKTAAFAAFLRLFSGAFASIAINWSETLFIISALTIAIGNITAVFQTSFKRMLAYSSIAHAGYMTMALLSQQGQSGGSLLFYTAAYSVSSLAAFAILYLVSNKTGNEQLEGFNGLASRNPFLAAITVVAMLSLAGIPPTAGFFAKYYIFTAAMEAGHTWLVIVGVLGSLVGVYYYFRPLIALFRGTSDATIELPTATRIFLIGTAVLAIALGLAPGYLSGLL
ncbi:MAG TPA: NADH-quinone oxidoreductase subunit N, partial [Bacteroidia bacterium]|nr:NADH-quinone oxidoreductase subunit N [Bacteroidia bacterium]